MSSAEGVSLRRAGAVWLKRNGGTFGSGTAPDKSLSSALPQRARGPFVPVLPDKDRQAFLQSTIVLLQ